MNPKIAKRLAALVIDQWPLPRWLSRRIAGHPEVARELERWESVAAELRGQANATADSGRPKALRELNRSDGSGLLVRGGRTWAVAIAASVLVAVTAWQFLPGKLNQQQEAAVQPSETDAMVDVDIRPVLASLEVGQEVAVDVREGLAALGGKLARAGRSIGSDFTLPRLQRESSSESIPQ